MDNVAKMCADICGIQIAINDITVGKPLLYQYAWKMIFFIENKNFTCWHVCNAQSLAHLPMLFCWKTTSFFSVFSFIFSEQRQY